MMKQRIAITAIIATVMFAGLAAIKHIDQLNDGIQFKQIEIQDNSAKLQLLNEKYRKLNEDKTLNEKEYQKQLKQLEAEKAKLQSDLQAKLDAKNRTVAQYTAGAVETATAAPSQGSCAEWIAAAGIADVANANELIRRESGCNPLAVNSSSGACGIAQELPCGKSGCSITDGACQVRWMNSYVSGRYGSWANAVAFHNANNWY